VSNDNGILVILKKEESWTGVVAQGVKCLSSKGEALSSNPSTAKKKKKERKKEI
jgi:hypothetical protein